MSEYFYNPLFKKFNFLILISSFSSLFKSFLSVPFSTKFLPNFLSHHYHPILPLISPFKHNFTPRLLLFKAFIPRNLHIHPLRDTNFLSSRWYIEISLSLTYSFKYFITFGCTYFEYHISIPVSCPFYFATCTSRCLHPSPFLMSISCHLFWNFDWITVDPYIILSCFLNFFLSHTFVSIPVYTSFIIEITMHDMLLV